MEYRVNFCWESNEKPPYNEHIVSVPFNDAARNCFTKRDQEYIDEKLEQGTVPGITIKHKSVIERFMKLYQKPDHSASETLNKIFSCWEHIVAGDNVIAWIESEDNIELGHYHEQNQNNV